MASDQDVRNFVTMLERLVFELADQTNPRLSPEQVRTRIAHKIAQTTLIQPDPNRPKARRLA